MKYEILKFYKDSAALLIKYTDEETNQSIEATLELPLHEDGGSYTDEEISAFVNANAPEGVFKYQTNRTALLQKYDFSKVTILPTEVVKPVLTEEQIADANARSTRNRLLYQSDWTQSNDFPYGEAKQAEWATYRQALRDITLQHGYPIEIIWPIAPNNN